jgi:hypothetical protein
MFTIAENNFSEASDSLPGKNEDSQISEKNMSVSSCQQDEEVRHMPQSTEIETKQQEAEEEEKGACVFSLTLLLQCIAEVVLGLVLSTVTFFKDCKYFLRRCTFPDLEGTTLCDLTSNFRVL